MSANTAFLKVIEASLQEQPDEWRPGEYWLVNNRRKLSIWIANAAYGLQIEFEGADVPIPFWWRRRIRRAVDLCIAKRAIAKFKEEAA